MLQQDSCGPQSLYVPYLALLGEDLYHGSAGKEYQP